MADQENNAVVAAAPQPAVAPASAPGKKAHKDGTGNPFEEWHGLRAKLLFVYCTLFMQPGLLTWYNTRKVVLHREGKFRGFDKAIHLWPMVPISIYLLIAYSFGASPVALAKIQWLVFFFCVWAAVDTVSTRWVGMYIGIGVGFIGMMSALAYTNTFHFLSWINNALGFFLNGGFDPRLALLMVIIIVVLTTKQFVGATLNNMFILLNNNFMRNRLSKEGNFPADKYRAHHVVQDWLERFASWSGKIYIRSVFTDTADIEDEEHRQVLAVENLPLARFAYDGILYATSVTDVERRGN